MKPIDLYEELLQEEPLQEEPPISKKIDVGIGYQLALCRYYIFMIHPPAGDELTGYYFSVDGKWYASMMHDRTKSTGGTYFDLFEKAESCCQLNNLNIVEYYDKKFDGIKYRMRWQFPKSKIIYLYGEFVKKYNSKLTIHQWMIGYGVVHSSVKENNRKN